MNQVVQLNYKALVQEYNNSLNTKLRGFRPSADFLEMWVPDSNHSKSLLNMFEAAEMGGVDRFSILVEAGLAQEIDRTQLVELASSVALITFHDVKEEEGALQIEVNLNKKQISNLKTTVADFRSSYRLALGEMAATTSIEYEKDLLVPSSAWIFMAQNENLNFSLAIEAQSGLVLQACHRGAISPEEKVLFDLVCRSVVGMPVQEAADHAMIKVEYSLRDPKIPTVRGIITPQNADPIFKKPLSLLRDIYTQYKIKSDRKEQINFYDVAPAAAWCALSVSDKISKVQNFIADFKTEALPEGSSPRVHRIDGEGGFRIFLTWQGEEPPKGKGAYLMKLERLMRDQIERRLEIFLEEWKDQNTKRRL